MTPTHNLTMTVNDNPINVTKVNGNDYICLTNMARSYGADGVVDNWLRNKNTIELLGVWETLNNPGFNSLEFEGIKNQAGLNKRINSSKVEASSYPRCPRHAHHTVTVRNWLHLYSKYNTTIMLTSILGRTVLWLKVHEFVYFRTEYLRRAASMIGGV